MEYDSAGVVDEIELFIESRELNESHLTIFGELDDNREDEGYQVLYSIHPLDDSGREFSIHLTYSDRKNALEEYCDQKTAIENTFEEVETRLAEPEDYIFSTPGGGNPIL
ncbi:hypothetical protein [Candidatus Nanohalobium constans]|uniref:Uncharacterized protein n=1 Tax=Candidatus Nanohalobium constans TaxID=2565781 RepID=A0A5Q0UHV5_9ARCH|nr:hypothetical protein [Candidatus Nanohalobium constans]QGA80469.1 hypothetical protein LC1Nh_0573 [Candidatus Nanohalobium constans]